MKKRKTAEAPTEEVTNGETANGDDSKKEADADDADADADAKDEAPTKEAIKATEPPATHAEAEPEAVAAGGDE